jgi:NitT/TauT family transport system ATP-binding protein
MPWTTMRGNVQLPLDLAHVSRSNARERVDQALAQVGLWNSPRFIRANCPAA